MKTLIEVITPVTDLVPGVTGICEIDGAFTVLDVQLPNVAIRFHDTGNVAVMTPEDVVHDQTKRKGSKDALHWYSVAVALHGFTYPNGRKVVDVIAKCRVLLDDGRFVSIEYKGDVPKIKSKPAYYKWIHIMKEPEAVLGEWHDFTVFQDWFITNLPKAKRRWALRSVDGTWGPDRCGFDDRTDLPVSTATLSDSVFTRP